MKLRPSSIKINDTVLADLHKYLKIGVQPNGHDPWNYYFDIR